VWRIFHGDSVSATQLAHVSNTHTPRMSFGFNDQMFGLVRHGVLIK